LIRKYFDDAFNKAKGKYSSVMARQVFYTIREMINHSEGVDIGESKGIYDTFTQKIVTKFQDKDTKYEAIYNERRGYFLDSFYKSETALSTKDVRRFIDRDYDNKLQIQTSTSLDFSPELLYNHILFIEKQGFTQLLQESGLLKKLNLGLICSQGFATRSAKELIQYFNSLGMKVYCLHDCDLSGNRIYHNLINSSNTFKHPLDVIDIGITVQDVHDYDKLPEQYRSKKSFANVLESIPVYERDFFYVKKDKDLYHYRRCEINSFTNDELLSLLRKKIKYEPVLPDKNIIENCIELDKEEIIKEALYRLYSDSLPVMDFDTSNLIQRVLASKDKRHWTAVLRSETKQFKEECIDNLSKII
jgi:hypothetical protein